jgi:hypothetical protein
MDIGLDSQVRRAHAALVERPGLIVLAALLPIIAGIVAAPLVLCPGYSSLSAWAMPEAAAPMAALGLFSWACTSVVLGICVGWWAEAARHAVRRDSPGPAGALSDGLMRVGRYVLITGVMLLALFLLGVLPWLGLSAAGKATAEAGSPAALPAALSLPLFVFWGLATGAFLLLTMAWPMAASMSDVGWLAPLTWSQATVRRHWPTFLGIAGGWCISMGALVALAMAFHIPGAIGSLVAGAPATATAASAVAALALITLWLAASYVNALASLTGFVAYADALGEASDA